jgi:hypothetical protein
MVLAIFTATAAHAAIPPVEQLLPADTLFVFAIPDCAKLRADSQQSPFSQFWNDPAMRPFREKFVAKWKEEFLGPLDRDLGVKFDDYAKLPQGGFALAVTQDGWQGRDDAPPGLLLLLDTRDKSDQLKKLLADLRKKWTDAGKAVRTEKIRDAEFFVVTLSSNDVPKTLRTFFPQHQEIQELGKEPEKKSADDDQLVVGQIQSLLIVGSSIKTVTKVVLRLAGGQVPALADNASFAANRLTFFRDALIFAWVNAAPVFDVLGHLPPEKPNPQAPSPMPALHAEKIVASTGLGGLKSVAFALRSDKAGTTAQFFLGVPESVRRGILKALAVEAKDSNPPPFVPADVMKFWRWRLDGPKTVDTVEKMISEISPQTLNTWNFLISSGEEAVKQDEPTYDLRKDLFANLGDDLIRYEKAPQGKTRAELESPPSLLLVGSPNPDQLVRALRGALVIRSGDALHPKTREFLGRKIYSISVPAVSGSARVASTPSTLHYAASGGYVAFSTDASMLEEYLRSGESQKKSLRETPGLNEAAQKVGGQNTGLFGYENRGESMRALFDALKQSASGSTNSSVAFSALAGTIPYARPEKTFKDWLDYSLLPDYDRVAKYFNFTVFAGSANVDGITFKSFSPTPLQSKP